MKSTLKILYIIVITSFVTLFGGCRSNQHEQNATGPDLAEKTEPPQNETVQNDWDWHTRLVGFMDIEGNVVIEPQYRFRILESDFNYSHFSDGLARIITIPGG